MKMVVAIIHPDSAAAVIERLSAKGFGVTSIPSRGGFLGEENCTLMSVVADEKVQNVISIIRSLTHRREVQVTDKDAGNSMLPNQTDGRITVSGATIFVLDVEQLLKV